MVQAKVLIFLCTITAVFSQLCRDCTIGTVKKLKTADCYRKELIQVPRCHTSGIEVLDLSFNRIREIGKDDLDSYPYVEILYLSDNIITEIDDRAIHDKHYIHTLDLSSNAFYEVPRAIFHLPKLRKLNLANIRNTRMVDDIEDAAPVSSPLVQLDLSNNKLVRLPQLGDVPTLLHYNVSGNKNVNVNISVFSGLCNLKNFANDDFTAVFENPCDCHTLNAWLKDRDVEFKEFHCENLSECNVTIPAQYERVFSNCKHRYEELQYKLLTQQILMNVGIGSGVILVLFIAVLVIFLRKKNKRRRAESMPRDSTHKKISDRDFD